MELDPHLLVGDLHLRRHGHQVLKDPAGVRVGVATHLAGQQPVKAAGDDQLDSANYNSLVMPIKNTCEPVK